MKRFRLALSALIEFLPVIVLFAMHDRYGFMYAVLGLALATVLSLVVSLVIDHRVPKFGLVAASAAVLFGGLTVALDEPQYIMFLDTLFFGVFALALFLGMRKGRLFLKEFFEEYFAITDRGWRVLSVRWGSLFVALAFLNEYVRLAMDAQAWVAFNALSALGTVAFGTYQFTLSAKERLPEASAWGLRVKS